MIQARSQVNRNQNCRQTLESDREISHCTQCIEEIEEASGCNQPVTPLEDRLCHPFEGPGSAWWIQGVPG